MAIIILPKDRHDPRQNNEGVMYKYLGRMAKAREEATSWIRRLGFIESVEARYLCVGLHAWLVLPRYMSSISLDD